MSNIGCPNKYFSYARIKWEIRRCSLIAQSQLLMCSPRITLSGPFETQWLLYIELSEANDKFIVRLENVHSENVESDMQVHWSCCILDEKNEGSFFGERVHLFDNKFNLVVEMLSLKGILDILNLKELDTLIMNCRMLVNFRVNRVFPESRVLGIMGLSHDLSFLPTNFLYNDLTTTVSDVNFSLHKAMLYQRGARISEVLEQSTSDMKINFNFYDPLSAGYIFKYLYTGDLRYILFYPNLTIPEYLETLNIPELKNIYSEQTLTIVTDVEFVVHEIDWTVKNFKNLKKTFYSPRSEVVSLKCTFQLSGRISVNEENEKTLCIEATLIEGEKQLAVSIEFFSVSNQISNYIYRRFNKIMSVKDKVGGIVATSSKTNPGFENFFNLNIVEITARFSIRVGEVVSAIEENVPPARPEITCEKSFGRLVKNMNNIYKSKDYSDFHFIINDEKIKAHKFLVAARSSVFNELFRRHEDLVSVKISDIESDVFHEFLSYMYTGLIRESDVLKLMDLHYLGEQYDVRYLKSVIATLMLNLINESNMLRVLMFASDNNLKELKEKALNYIVSKVDLLEDHPDFYRFKLTRLFLYEEVQKLSVPEEE